MSVRNDVWGIEDIFKCFLNYLKVILCSVVLVLSVYYNVLIYFFNFLIRVRYCKFFENRVVFLWSSS